MDSHDLQRRAVLGGTLLAGVSLLVGGCKPKQEDAGTGGTQSNGGSMKGAPAAPPTNPSTGGTAPTPPAGAAKMSKAQAQYQDMPKGSQMCANCNQFIATTSTCKVVEGQVNARGWCLVWTAVQPA